LRSGVALSEDSMPAGYRSRLWRQPRTGGCCPIRARPTQPRSWQSLELRNSDTARERPYTIANFVASVDGRATIDGLSRKLSDPGDRDLFRSLRERADAVLVGTATLAAENYGRMLPQAERRERRLAGRPQRRAARRDDLT